MLKQPNQQTTLKQDTGYYTTDACYFTPISLNIALLAVTRARSKAIFFTPCIAGCTIQQQLFLLESICKFWNPFNICSSGLFEQLYFFVIFSHFATPAKTLSDLCTSAGSVSQFSQVPSASERQATRMEDGATIRDRSILDWWMCWKRFAQEINVLNINASFSLWSKIWQTSPNSRHCTFYIVPMMVFWCVPPFPVIFQSKTLGQG